MFIDALRKGGVRGSGVPGMPPLPRPSRSVAITSTHTAPPPNQPTTPPPPTHLDLLLDVEDGILVGALDEHQDAVAVGAHTLLAVALQVQAGRVGQAQSQAGCHY